MNIVRFNAGDKLEMKKNHPCGGNIFTVVRTGSDVRIICDRCGRDMTMPRVKLEKAIAKVIKTSSDAAQAQLNYTGEGEK